MSAGDGLEAGTGVRSACRAVLPGRSPCPEDAQPGGVYCSRHVGPLRRDRPATPAAFFREWRASAEGLLARTLRGEPAPPPGAYDPALVRTLLPVALPLYYWYFRVEVEGIENIPTEGAAVFAANHSGTLPLDGAVLKIGVLNEHGRNPWLLAADLAFQIPGFGPLLRRAGNARASREETMELLGKGELIGVFPEGFKGIGKGWRNRYHLQRFGRGGFVEVAIESGAPIVPVAIIGAEETYPMIGNLDGMARRLGLPYMPITPTFPLLGPFGLVPLPSKWIMAFGEPIPMVAHPPSVADDTQLVLEVADEIRQRVQAMVIDLLPKRRRTFL